MKATNILLPQTPTTKPTIPPSEDVVKFLWRSPKPGDAGVIVGGDPRDPLKRIDLFYLVLETKPDWLSPINSKFVCLVTDRKREITTKETIAIQYFLTAEKPVPSLLSTEGLDQLKRMLGSFSFRYLIDMNILS